MSDSFIRGRVKCNSGSPILPKEVQCTDFTGSRLQFVFLEMKVGVLEGYYGEIGKNP